MRNRQWIAAALGAGVGLGIGLLRAARRQPPVDAGAVRRPAHLASRIARGSVMSEYLYEAGEAGYLCAN